MNATGMTRVFRREKDGTIKKRGKPFFFLNQQGGVKL